MLKLALLLVAVCVLGASALSRPYKPNIQVGKSATECIVCGIVVNEIEGFIAENISEAEIEKIIKKDVCPLFPGPLKPVCNDMSSMASEIINNMNNKYPPAGVCIDHGFCETPFTQLSDPQPVSTYVINLDLPPIQRWTKICSNSSYKAVMTELIDALEHLFDNISGVNELGELINSHYFPSEYAQEIRGCAAAMGVEWGWLTWVNLGYEVTSACTSIVAQTKQGKVYHVRNMDFWDGIWLTDHLKNLTMTLDFQKGGKTQYYATSFAGYVGILSGMKPNVFSVSINTRYYPKNGLKNFLYEIVAAIMEKNNSLVSFLTRNAMNQETTFSGAMNLLSNGPLIADVYYTVAGSNAFEGAVISRNILNASDIWRLNATQWYLAQTNYDHWVNPPWFDDRVIPANDALNALGQDNVGYEGLFKVLSVKPVLNIQSTFTMLTSPVDGSYTSYTRWCPYPCVE